MHYQKLFLFSLLLVVSQGASEKDTSTYEIDLYPPLEQIWTKLKAVEPFKPLKFVDALVRFLVCITPTTTTPSPTTSESEIESVLTEAMKDEPIVFGLPPEAIEWLKNYVKTAEFEEIHHFLWCEEPEWEDLVHLLYAKGFQDPPGTTPPIKDIYALVKTLYEELGVPDYSTCKLPTGPPPFNETTIRNSNAVHHRTKRSLTFETLKEHFPFLALMKEDGRCNWEEFLPELLNGLEWFGIVKFIGTEVKGNPAIHVLWAKIYEHKKGEAFRRFRELPATKCMEHYLMQMLAKNELWKLVIDILEGLTGIDFGSTKINVVSNIISFAEYLVWRTSFPNPANPSDVTFYNEACTAFNATRIIV